MRHERNVSLINRKVFYLCVGCLVLSTVSVFVSYLFVIEELRALLANKEMSKVNEFLAEVDTLYVLALGSRGVIYLTVLAFIVSAIMIMKTYIKNAEGMIQKGGVIIAFSISIVIFLPELFEALMITERFIRGDLITLGKLNVGDISLNKLWVFSEKSIALYEKFSRYWLKVQLLVLATTVASYIWLSRIQRSG